jgi:teichuronic acid biosynthesis glycosyltransferase TuaG
MSANEKVSIIIPFYNCMYIPRAITSVLNQTYKNIEILVIDDGSTKHINLLHPFLAKIKYIRKVANSGTASALNEGLKGATGDYIAWLSSDDIFVSNKIEVQLDQMKKNNAKFSFTNYLFINDETELLASAPTSLKFQRKELLRLLIQGCPINGSTVMFSRELISKVGYFDESLLYANDYDYWIRSILKYDLHYINEVLTYYRLHREMGSKKHRKKIFEETEIVQKRYSKILNDLINSH